MYNKKGLIDVNKMAIRLQSTFPKKLTIASVQRIIFLIMKDLDWFNDQLVLEFVRRGR